MARGRDEHRMVFDIRGRRGIVIKVVYVFFALLMVASLFLVTGAVNINTLFGNSNEGESPVTHFQKETERIETKLHQEPKNEDLLANLTRARVNVATSMINGIISSGHETQSGVEEVKQELAQVSEDWSNYLAVAKEPSAGLSALVAPALERLAGLSSSGGERREVLKAAAEAEEIITERRPDSNSWASLAYLLLYSGNFKAAEKAKDEATKLSETKFARESFENQYEKVEKAAREFEKELKLEKASKRSEATGEGSGTEKLGLPSLNGLGGTALGG